MMRELLEMFMRPDSDTGDRLALADAYNTLINRGKRSATATYKNQPFEVTRLYAFTASVTLKTDDGEVAVSIDDVTLPSI